MSKVKDLIESLYPYMIDGESRSLLCGPGWFEIIKDTLQEVAENDPLRSVRIRTVKEKFAGLRIYVDYLFPEDFKDSLKYRSVIEELLYNLERLSFDICEGCGDWGERKVCGHWLKTYCPTCFEHDAKERLHRQW